MQQLLLFAIFLASWVGVPAFADHHGTAQHLKMRQAQFIDRYDADRDYKVSSVEFEQARRKRFDITDDDQSGTVSSQEYVYEWEDRLDSGISRDRAFAVTQTYRRFDALDENDDAAIAWSEYDASGQRMFAAHETDKNGEINSADAEHNDPRFTSREPLTEEQEEAERARLVLRANRMIRMPSTHTREGMFSKYDSDGNAIVSLEEFDLARKADFVRSDINQNGSVDEEEYVIEFEDRLDTHILETRSSSVKQAGRRFKALDINDDGKMTFAEYQRSGHQMFKRWDTGDDGYVSRYDALPKSREQSSEQQKDTSATDASITPSIN